MPSSVRVPDKIGDGDFIDFVKPATGTTDRGKAWAWNDLTGRFEPALIELAGVAASLLSAHVAAANPHPQYYLSSGISAFGALLIDDGDAATARGTLGLGTAAVLNVGTSANNVVQLDGSARLPAVNGSLLTNITVAAAGSTTQVIFNDAGAYAGDSGLTFAKATDRLTIAGGIVTPSIRPASNSTTALQWQDASGTAFVTGDTTNRRIGIGGSPALPVALSVYGAAGADVAYFVAATTGTGFYTKADTGVTSVNIGFVDSSNSALGALVASSINHAAHSANFDIQTRVGGSLVNAIRVSASGLVGIGTGTGSVLARLHVLDSSGNYHLRIENTATGGGYWHIAQADNTFGSGGGKLLFLPDSTASANAKIVFTNAGQVGIGSLDPTALLDVAASTTARASLRIRSGTLPTTPNDGDIAHGSAGFVFYNVDAGTNNVINHVVADRQSSGTAAAGFGTAFAALLESSTTASQDAGRIQYLWNVATHASRASDVVHTVFSTTTEQEFLRGRANSGGVQLGFYGVTPVARQLVPTGSTVDAVITALQNLGLFRQS